jgi:aryl-alcohol dehydrogenase-like predicted oxidoreductase
MCRMNNSKLAIGSANFGLNYGLSNSAGRLNAAEVYKILEYAQQSKIQYLDTAHAYGNAHHILSEFVEIEKFEVITKYTSEQILGQRQNLQELINEIPGRSRSILIHDRYSERDEVKFMKALEILNFSQQAGQIKKFGMSIYSLEELDFALNRIDIGLLQIPLNVFDQRFVDTTIVERLTNRKIEVHARSCFLQGLLTQKADQRNVYFDHWNALFKSWDEYTKFSGKSSLFFALKFVLSQSWISKIVVGVDTLDQLIDLRNIEQEKYIIEEDRIKKFSSADEDLILPMNWRLQ